MHKSNHSFEIFDIFECQPKRNVDGGDDEDADADDEKNVVNNNKISSPSDGIRSFNLLHNLFTSFSQSKIQNMKFESNAA